jgi:hypothetical protein
MKTPKEPDGKGKKKERTKQAKPPAVRSKDPDSPDVELGTVIVLMLREANGACLKAGHDALAKSKWQSPITRALLKLAKHRILESASRVKRARAALNRTGQKPESSVDRKAGKRRAEELLRRVRSHLRGRLALIARFGDPSVPEGKRTFDPDDLSSPSHRDFFASALASDDDWTLWLEQIGEYARRRDVEFFQKLGRALEPNRPRAPLFKPREEFLLLTWDNGIGPDLNYVGISEQIQRSPGIKALYNSPPLKFWTDEAAGKLLDFLFPTRDDPDSTREIAKSQSYLRSRLSLESEKTRKIRGFDVRNHLKTGEKIVELRT